ncbi:MAG: FHA domain-containing protein [Bryobacteraceae bacterium]
MDLIVTITSKNDDQQNQVECAVEPRIVFGRTPESPMVLDGPGVSREHLAFESESGSLFAVDLSANGTWVNGTRIPRSRRHRVTAGDVVELPGYELRLEMKGAAPVTVRETGVIRQESETGLAPQEPPPTPAKSSPLGQVTGFIGSFTVFERLTVVVDVICLCLLVWYFTQ